MINPEVKTGDRIICYHMESELSVPPGTKGTVVRVSRDPFESNDEKIINYFRKHNLNIIANYRFEKNVESSRVVNTLKNLKTFEPNLIDLYKIHNFILLNKRTSVLEFGCGWSSLVIEHAIRLNKKKFNKEISKFIINRNFFKHYAVDNSAKYLSIAKKRNIKIFGNKDRISNFFFFFIVFTIKIISHNYFGSSFSEKYVAAF